MFYGVNVPDLNRRAASYVDNIKRGCETNSPAHRATYQVRVGGQPQDRQGARPHDPAVGAWAGGPRDPVASAISWREVANERVVQGKT